MPNHPYPIHLKRVYETVPTPQAGERILVDRLWPRGVRKEEAKVDLWLKEVAPSSKLRRFFHHEAGLFGEFKERYRAELEEDPLHRDALRTLIERCKKGPVTLLYGAKDEVHNQAVVLREYLLQLLESERDI